jgi:hypothetical protein
MLPGLMPIASLCDLLWMPGPEVYLRFEGADPGCLGAVVRRSSDTDDA